MDDRFNTAAGWVLFSGIVALGGAIASGMHFEAGEPHHIEEGHGGYPIEDLDASAADAETVLDIGKIWEEVTVEDGQQQAVARCGTCHTFDQGGATGQGPNLYGVMGKPIGQHAAGFAYSSALAGKGGTWTIEAMNEWLLAPKSFVPGTTMGFAGLKDDAARIAIIKYVNSMGSNLTPPAPLPEEAEAAPEGEDAAVETETEGTPEAEAAVATDRPATANE